MSCYNSDLPFLTEDTQSTISYKIDLSFLQLHNEAIDGHLYQVLDSQQVESPDAIPSSSIQEDTSQSQHLYLQHNQLTCLPLALPNFQLLKVLDLSSNRLTTIGDEILNLRQLGELFLRNNFLDDESLPKDFGTLKNLTELNLSGNRFTTIVPQILELGNLQGLFLGGNRLERVQPEIGGLVRLKVLYLGGNELQEIPAEMGYLQSLQALILCENKLESLPSTISHLRRLRSLALHKNNLTTLPREIVRLQGLTELSLRDNPLVVRFVRDMVYNPPSLLELAARMVKLKNIPYTSDDLPQNLLDYLRTAHRCVNPKCRGVYFDARVEHIKFVDFCGKYRIPLLQYLCSSRCTNSANAALFTSSESSDLSEDDDEVPVSRLKKVLLG